MRQERLAKSDYALFHTDTASSNHEPVFVNGTVVGESAHWRDTLDRKIVLRGRGVLLSLLPNAVDFLV